jgi:RimJ/RimL family protein N-acetyltransferase
VPIRLLPATAPLLEAFVASRERFGDLIGSPVPDGWPEFPEAIAFTLAQLADPDADPAWTMQFFIDEDTGLLVGSGGYVTPPVDRTVEIGYEVAPEFRGRGLGVGAARALVDGAVRSGDVDHVVAHTLPGPNASTGVLASLGFRHTGEQTHPEEGTVWGWELAVS